MKIITSSLTFLLLSSISSIACASAWDNYARVFNNTTQPITIYAEDPQHGGIHPGQQNIVIPAEQSSDRIDISTHYQWFPPKDISEGAIDLHGNNIPANCKIQYYFSGPHTSWSSQHSLSFTAENCSSDTFSPNQILFDSPNNESYAPLFNTLDIPLPKLQPNQFSDELSSSNCSKYINGQWDSPSNCIIINPNKNAVLNSLKAQESIDNAEPLKNIQLLGTHNSIIGPDYTTDDSNANMSYSDPNQSLSVPQQLDLGARFIELDFLAEHNTLISCHDHADLHGILKKIGIDITCDDNTPLQNILTNINTWSTAHKNSVIILFFDVNQPLSAEQYKDIDKMINATFNNIAFSKADLPAGTSITELSKNAILTKQKNIIFLSHDLGFKDSPYIFTTMGKAEIPYDAGTDDVNSKLFPNNNFVCNNPQTKYAQIQKLLYTQDPLHNSFWRINTDRTFISYLGGKRGDSMSLSLMQLAKKCPVNIINLDRLNATYTDQDHYKNSLDPRLNAYLWSWAPGYPLENNSSQAYIDPATGHFKNDAQPAPDTDLKLCVDSSGGQPYTWTFIPYSQNCVLPARFATPVTAYEMADVINAIPSTQQRVWVNYNRGQDGAWVANRGQPL
jgi:hypothetical protein